MISKVMLADFTPDGLLDATGYLYGVKLCDEFGDEHFDVVLQVEIWRPWMPKASPSIKLAES
jgi:hypothetical protein